MLSSVSLCLFLSSFNALCVLTNQVKYDYYRIMARKLILYELQGTSQGHAQGSCPTDGLRLLARMIARELTARQSGYENSNKYQDAASQLKVATSLESKTNTQGRKAKQDA